MPTTILSNHEFGANPGRALAATRDGHVVITEEGRATQVLLGIDEYRRLQRTSRNIVDLLSMQEFGDSELDLPERSIEPERPIDFE